MNGGTRPARPRLVHVTTTDVSLALLLGPQLRAFADAGYEVIGASAPGPWVDQLAEWGVEHRPLRNATRSMAPHRDLAALVELTRLFRSIRPDIVHTHNPKPGVYGRLAARAARVPAIVNTVHGLYALPDDPWPKRAVVYSLERLAAMCSDAELIQNPEDLPVLRRLGIPERKLHLLGNGVDLERFDRAGVAPGRIAALRAEIGAEPGDVVCGAVGRLVWEKGYRELFDAAARACGRVPNLRFVVVGPDEPEKADALRPADLVAAAGSAPIRFLGLRHDLVDLYAAMDVYVLASHREGFPRSAMEAAAMGLPVIATDIRGCRQVVDDGVNGRLVPVRDATALAAAIEDVARDGEMRAAMSAASLRKARAEFDQQRQIDLTLSVYEPLLSSPRRVRA